MNAPHATFSAHFYTNILFVTVLKKEQSLQFVENPDNSLQRLQRLLPFIPLLIFVLFIKLKQAGYKFFFMKSAILQHSHS